MARDDEKYPSPDREIITQTDTLSTEENTTQTETVTIKEDLSRVELESPIRRSAHFIGDIGKVAFSGQMGALMTEALKRTF